MNARFADPALLGLALGALLLLFGRRLFWLMVAVSGFLAGMHLAAGLVPERSLFLVALLAGVIGAVLAVVLQKVAIAFTGFAAGGYFAMQLLPMLRVHLDPAVMWIVVFICAVIGAVALLTLFGWALIVLSSAVGAALVVDALHLQHGVAAAAMLGLIVLGVAVQARLFPARRRETLE